MKSLAIPAFLLTSAIAATSAFAEPGSPYIGASFHLGTYDESNFPKANPNGIKIEMGKYLADNVAIESHLLLGSGSDTITESGIDFGVKLKNVLSFFVKGDIPISESANFYGLIGFTKGKLEFSIPAYGLSGSDDDSGLSYGLGIEAEISDNLYFSGEYVYYLSDSDYDYTGFNFGISKLF